MNQPAWLSKQHIEFGKRRKMASCSRPKDNPASMCGSTALTPAVLSLSNLYEFWPSSQTGRGMLSCCCLGTGMEVLKQFKTCP